MKSDIVNRGIRCRIKTNLTSTTAPSGATYVGVLYMKPSDTTHVANGTASLEDSSVYFSFPDTETLKLVEGVCTFEVYDSGSSGKTQMYFKCGIPVRDNSVSH